MFLSNIHKFMHENRENHDFHNTAARSVRSTSHMKFMRKQRVQVIDHLSFDVHNTLAGSSQIDFFDG